METINTAEETATKKINPKVVGIVLAIIILAGLAYYFKNYIVAATVDGHFINRWAVVKKLEKQSGKTVLDSMIDDQLISNAAKKNNISVSEADMNKKLDEIKAQIEASGSTFEVALSTANLTLAELQKQIVLQLKLEKLLGDKINVTDEELIKYIADNKIPIPAGEEASTKDQVRNQIKSQKFNSEASNYLNELRLNAKIRTFVNY